MYWNDFNVISSKADIKLFTDPNFQLTVDYCIDQLLRKNEGDISWIPDSLWIDSDNQEVHLWMSADRERTNRFMRYEEQ